MPLIQSKRKKDIGKNVEIEMEAGKPQKQALAIAFNVQRKNKKKMAKGGPVSAQNEKMDDVDSGADMQMVKDRQPKSQAGGNFVDSPANHMAAHSKSVMGHESDPDDLREEHHEDIDMAITPEEMAMIHEHRARQALAKGGAVGIPKPQQNVEVPEAPEHNRPYSIAKGILKKKPKVKAMADGGEVDLSRNADEDENLEDDLSFEALRKENYSESEGLEQLDQPMDSNEHGDDIEKDKHDMIGSIRSRMKAKRSR